MATLMPNQKYPGGWIPSTDGGYILVLSIKKSPSAPYVDYMSFCSPIYHSGDGGGPFASIPYDFSGPTLLSLNVPIPGIRPDDYSCTSGIEYKVVTHPNNADNNKKYKDIAYVDPNYIPEDAEPEYVPINTDYHMQEWPKTLVENLGAVNAVYELEGAIVLRDKSLFVSGMGYSPAKNYGKVFYWMTATVLIDGQVFMQKSLEPSGGAEAWPDNKFFPIGSANFDLPEPEFGQKTELVLEGAYTYKNDSGNYIVPEEYYAKYEMNIDIRQKQKEEAPIL